MEEIQVNVEEVKLPSNGLIYPLDNPLSKGIIEMKYMTAKEEDILLNQNYLKNGTALDKLMKSLIVTPINYDDLIIGDKNAIMIAARILGYGPEYTFEFEGETQTVDLSQIDSKPLDESYFTPEVNEFKFILPFSKIPITFKLLTGKDEKNLNRELEGLKKIYKDNVPELSTRLKHIITSIDGDPEITTIREFVDKQMLARDSQALRSHIKKIQPDLDLTFFPTGTNISVNIPIGINFFWPDI
jgi:hypothetical protein